MRAVSVIYGAEASKPVTTPGFLLEVSFEAPEPPLRISSRGDVNFNGEVYIKWGFEVKSLPQDGARVTAGADIVIDNTDNTIGTLVLSQGIADRRVRLWSFYGDGAPGVPLSLSTADAFLEFAGFGDEAAIDPKKNTVSLSLQPENAMTAYGPRTYITPANGFNFAPAAGQLLHWGGETYTLQGEQA